MEKEAGKSQVLPFFFLCREPYLLQKSKGKVDTNMNLSLN